MNPAACAPARTRVRTLADPDGPQPLCCPTLLCPESLCPNPMGAAGRCFLGIRSEPGAGIPQIPVWACLTTRLSYFTGTRTLGLSETRVLR